jgi:5-methyltetrahydropteroyltriglutamate--homocysteine methyltransferase
MKRSTDRILTTHVGSLIRPQALQDFLRAKQTGKTYDTAAYDKCLSASVAEVVHKQAEVGIDVISDGEFGKSISWSQYVLERLSGFERRPIKSGANPFTRGVDREQFAEFYAELDAREGVATTVEAVCTGPIAYTGRRSCNATSTISKPRSKASMWSRRSCRWRRRPASSPTARTNITKAKKI